MNLKYKSGFCKHPECKGKGEVLIGNSNRSLCIRHNQLRLLEQKQKSGKLLKKKNKDWRLDPRKVLDAVFAKYILALFPARCYTSGKENIPLECGHYISRQHDATRWLVDNCRPQSHWDNCGLRGNVEIFRRELVIELGEPRVEEIEILSKSESHFSKPELEEMTSEFTKKLEQLQNN